MNTYFTRTNTQEESEWEKSTSERYKTQNYLKNIIHDYIIYVLPMGKSYNLSQLFSSFEYSDLIFDDICYRIGSDPLINFKRSNKCIKLCKDKFDFS